MIYGIGTDLVKISRIRKAIDRSPRFLERYYTVKERDFLEKKEQRIAASAAMNFAGKEAVSKALRTGICKEVRLEQIEILRDDSGAPYVVVYGETKEYVKGCGVDRIHISLSDTDEMAAAFVILESDQ